MFLFFKKISVIICICVNTYFSVCYLYIIFIIVFNKAVFFIIISITVNISIYKCLIIIIFITAFIFLFFKPAVTYRRSFFSFFICVKAYKSCMIRYFFINICLLLSVKLPYCSYSYIVFKPFASVFVNLLFSFCVC